MTDELRTVREQRGKDYGPVFANHTAIGQMWGGILAQATTGERWFPGEAIPPELVTLMMAAVKMSREAFKHKQDNIVDGLNYITFTGEMSQ